MIEIIPDQQKLSRSQPMSGIEKSGIAMTLGASFRSFEGEVDRATVRFQARSAGELRCTIDVETRAGSVRSEAMAETRASAFLLAAESLDRLLFNVLYAEADRVSREGCAERFAA